ncbi:uncharacterized protein BO80DRAFT_462697 [Aspergillus ibericus CBS 121593]|uniref:Uncharacterized protein n=1 Tax=Aspergillus ibericus CBS 121593 TaxID=1448316 RepID=A0A395H794_9EURO|nr:hypothetical protein BO80DRAFT_462697 [Aspergillus ibericus CBS 121593]RAL03496.1 hypothetical protein BO80DRAFT_462697 [Aspergillus ibericus CBS 121593]
MVASVTIDLDGVGDVPKLSVYLDYFNGHVTAMISGGTVLKTRFLDQSSSVPAAERPHPLAVGLSDCLSKCSRMHHSMLFDWFAHLVSRGTLLAPVLEFVHGQAGSEQHLQGVVQTQA